MKYQDFVDLLPNGGVARISKNVRARLCGTDVDFHVKVDMRRFPNGLFFMSAKPANIYIRCPDGEDFDSGITDRAEKEMEEAVNKFTPVHAVIRNGVCWGVHNCSWSGRPQIACLYGYYFDYADRRPTEEEVKAALKRQESEWKRGLCRTPATTDSDEFGPA